MSSSTANPTTSTTSTSSLPTTPTHPHINPLSSTKSFLLVDILSLVFSQAYFLFTLSLVLLSLLGLFITLLLLYLFIRPFSLVLFRRLSCHVGSAAYLDILALFSLQSINVLITGDSDIPTPMGASLLVCNHVVDTYDPRIRHARKRRIKRVTESDTAIVTQRDYNDNDYDDDDDTTDIDWWCVMMMCRVVGLRGTVRTFLQKFVSKSTTNTNATTNTTTSTTLAAMNATISTPLNTKTSVPSKNYEGESIIRPFVTQILHTLFEYPLLSPENDKNYIQDRSQLFDLLRSMAKDGAPAPVHLLLFPEKGSVRQRHLLAKSIDCAKKEGRPLLRHLLLPHTTGFYASLDCLRESSPVVYDITLAYKYPISNHQQYDTNENLDHDKKEDSDMHHSSWFAPTVSLDLSWKTLYKIITGKGLPSEIHVKIKKYGMEEVLQDALWLDKKWAEKDRLLDYFYRHSQFPTLSAATAIIPTKLKATSSSVPCTSNYHPHYHHSTSNRVVDAATATGAGTIYYGRYWTFNTRTYNIESSLTALLRLGLLPLAMPIILILMIPLFFMASWLYLALWSFRMLFPGLFASPGFLNTTYQMRDPGTTSVHPASGKGGGVMRSESGTESEVGGSIGSLSRSAGTPFFPPTPFASPTHIATWTSSGGES